MKIRDIILIVILVFVSLAGLITGLPGQDTGDAYIYVKNRLYGRYSLSDDRDITIKNENGIINEIVIRDNSIYMKDANCPNRLCVQTGRIRHENESICCVPSGVLIVIRSSEKGEYDAVTK